MYNQQQRRRGQPSPIQIGMLIQLLSQLENSQYKPPVTIMLLFVNIFVHLSPYVNFLGYDLTNIGQNCIHPAKIVNGILHGQGLNRLFLSSIIHVDDMHLYYNMLSLCWKGIHLESSIGSVAYLQLVVFSLLVSHSLMVLVPWTLDIMGVDPLISGFHSCAVGFSAVLFSLKYVWNAQSHSQTSNVMGIPVPTRYAAWLELVLISLISPNVSFVGHLCGILAGMLYLHGYASIVRRIVPSAVLRLLSDLFAGGDNFHSADSTRYTYASGTATSSAPSRSGTAQPRSSDNLHSTSRAHQSTSSSHSTSRNTGTAGRSAAAADFDAAEIELEEEEEVEETAESRAARADEARLQRLRRFAFN